MNKITCNLTADQYISVLRKLAAYAFHKNECWQTVQEILITATKRGGTYTVKFSPDGHALIYSIVDEYIKSFESFKAARLVDNVKSSKELQAALMQFV